MQKVSLLPAWMSGIMEAAMMKSVAAARNEQVSRTLRRLPVSMTSACAEQRSKDRQQEPDVVSRFHWPSRSVQ
jgi:hypothetical protein